MTNAPEIMWRETIAASPMYPDGGSFYHETEPEKVDKTIKYVRFDLLADAEKKCERLRAERDEAIAGKVKLKPLNDLYVKGSGYCYDKGGIISAWVGDEEPWLTITLVEEMKLPPEAANYPSEEILEEIINGILKKKIVAILEADIFEIQEDILSNRKVSDIDAFVADLHKRADAFGMLLSDPPKAHPNAIALRKAADTIIALRAENDRLSNLWQIEHDHATALRAENDRPTAERMTFATELNSRLQHEVEIAAKEAGVTPDEYMRTAAKILEALRAEINQKG